MDTTCIICNKTFASKQSLNVHKKTAKSCSGNLEKITYDCSYCEKKFSSSSNLKYHIDVCTIKKEKDTKNYNDKLIEKESEYKREIENLKQKEALLLKQKEDQEKEYIIILKEREIDCVKQLKSQEYNFKNLEAEYKEELNSNNKTITKLETTIEHLSEQLKKHEENSVKQIQELQNKIERLACKAIEKKSKTTVTNNTTNIEIHQTLPSQEKITEIIKEKFNHDYLISGPKGVANFVHKEMIRGENGELLYKCYDVSRQRFTFYNELGEEVKDYNSYKLIGMIHPEILKKGLEISKNADKEYELLKAKKDKSSEEVDKMFYLKSATEIQLPKCLTDIKFMKKENTFSRELSRLIS